MCTLRKQGILGVVICSDTFLPLARMQARVLGVPDLDIVAIPHPLGGLALEELRARASLAITSLLTILERMVA